MGLPPSELLQAILQGTANPLLVLSRDGIVIEVNHAALRWMEARREAVVGKTVWELNPWNGSAILRDSIRDALQGGQREFEALHHAFSVRAVAGTELYIAEGLDVSALEAERQHMRFAFETANLSSWSWDLASNTVTSHSPRGVFGLDPHNNTLRLEAISRVHPDDRDYLLAEADSAVESRSGFRVEVRGVLPGTGDVKWIAISGTVRCNEAGEPVRVDGISMDITERKEADLRVRESESRFRAIFENAGIGIALLDADGIVLESNPALEQLLGFSAAELRNMHFADFTHPDDIKRDVGNYEDLFAGRRQRYEIEKRYIRKNGELMWGKLVVSVIRNASGDPEFGLGMAQDITPRKRAEQELLALSDRLINTQEQERSRIARELHDGLGQQIAALSLSVSALKRRIPEQEVESKAEILRLQQRIAAIAEGVRRISHELHPAVLELAGIVPALRSYCKQFSSDNRVAVSLEADGEFEGIPADAALCLYRVTQEALQNVAKHSGATEARVQLERSGDGVVLTAADRGQGFDPEAPVARTGLGLVSMKERARLLNGRMEITSAPGQGTTVRVSIPIAAEMSV